jgi:sulfur carrier protein ThiS adenylyltransferase
VTRESYRAILGGKTVGIAGAGGLGSNCAAALARAGVGRLVVADFDHVCEADLDRQFFFRDQVGKLKVEALADSIRRIDPRLAFEGLPLRLDAASVPRVFARCDALVEALDSAQAKRMLIEAVLSEMPELPLVAASGIAGFGRSGTIVARRSGRLVMVGDCESQVGPDSPPMAGRVGIASAMQADAVLEILLS